MAIIGNPLSVGVSDYSMLADKPQINSVTLSGNMLPRDLYLENYSAYIHYEESNGTIVCTDSYPHPYTEIRNAILADGTYHAVAILNLSSGKHIETTDIRCNDNVRDGIVCTFFDKTVVYIIEHYYSTDDSAYHITFTTRDVTSVGTADLTAEVTNKLVPAGGSSGQVLAKTSGSDNAVGWINQDYGNLSNKPKINNVTLTGNKSSSDLGIGQEIEIAYGLATAESINSTLVAGNTPIIYLSGKRYELAVGPAVLSTNPTYVFTSIDENGMLYWAKVVGNGISGSTWTSGSISLAISLNVEYTVSGSTWSCNKTYAEITAALSAKTPICLTVAGAAQTANFYIDNNNIYVVLTQASQKTTLVHSSANSIFVSAVTDVSVDSTLSTSSHNAIENAAVATALAGKASSSDIPDASNTSPSNLGTADAGASNDFARADHVHNMPSAYEVGAIAEPANASSGDVLVYNGSSWEAEAPATEIEWVEYGSSSSSDIEAAYDDGKIVVAIVEFDNLPYRLPLVKRNSSTSHLFAATDGFTLLYAECISDVWTSGMTYFPLPQMFGTPSNLGTPSAGSASTWSRSDHVHRMPSASDVGAIAAPSSPSAGNVLTYSGSAWTAAAPVVPKYTTLTIATTDWSSSSCTKTVTGMTSTAVVWIEYSDTTTEFTCSQSTDSLTFTCNSTPSAAVTVKVSFIEGVALT